MLVGHHKQWQFLKRMAEQGTLPHALLFSGPAHIGKRKVALELAKLLFCEEEQKGPCQKCIACREIERGIHPDVFALAPTGSEISIAEVRDITARLALKPLRGNWRVAILDEVHRMRQETQSALLKILEEPPGNAILLLISSRPGMLFPTIRSRMQQIKFFLVPKDEIEHGFRELGFSLQKIAGANIFARGRPGIALNFLENPGSLLQYKRAREEFLALFRAGVISRFRYAKGIAESTVGSEPLIAWLEHTRALLLSLFAKRIHTPERQGLTRFLSVLENRELLLSTTNVNRQLALEVLLLEMPQIKMTNDQ